LDADWNRACAASPAASETFTREDPPLIRRLALVAIVSWRLLCQAPAAPPAITRISPAAVQPGKTVALSLRGERLGGPLTLWTSFPAETKWEAAEGAVDEVTARTCQVTLSEGVPPGIGGLLVVSTSGMSKLHFLMIDELREVTDGGENHSFDRAQPVELPVAVDGVVDGKRSDHYRFHGKRGQRVAVEVFATRLGSELDAVLRLLGPDGRQLTWADDAPSLGGDCRFAFSLPRDGDYGLELRDNRYRSGGRYRVRLGDFPLVGAPYPLGVRRGSTRKVTFADLAGKPVASRLLRVPGAAQSWRALPAHFPEGGLESATALIVDDLPAVTEHEPNDSPETANRCVAPAAFNGRLQTSGDRDTFEFAAVENQTLTFRSTAASLGSPTAPSLQLYDAQGDLIAESPVRPHDEWSFDHRFPGDGVYRGVVRDLLGRGGPGHVYRVTLRPALGFSLTLHPETPTQFQPSAGKGAFQIKLRCDRRGYDGPVELSFQSPESSLQLINPTIPAGATEHTLLIAVAPSTPPGQLATFRIRGRRGDVWGDASFNDSTLASSLARLRRERPQMIFPPHWLRGRIFAAVTAKAEPFFTSTLTAASVPFDRDQGAGKVRLTLERHDESFKAAPQILVRNLPADFTSEVASEDDSFSITLRGSDNAARVPQSVQVWVYGELEGRGIVQTHALRLNLDSPAAPKQSASEPAP
jgi:hypothetical protein